MDKSKEKEKLMDLIVDAKRADPETGGFTEWLAGFLLDHGVMVPADDGPGADRKGRCSGLAFNIGDSIWQTNGINVFKLKVNRLIYDCGYIAFDASAIGKTVFKTEDEAEATLAKMREEGCE